MWRTRSCGLGACIARRGPEFIRRSIGYARMMTGAPVLVGMDGGNDSLENIRVCQEEKVDWLIKRNPRRESEGEWLKISQEEGELQPSRAGERVWVGESYWTSLGEEPARVIELYHKRGAAEQFHGEIKTELGLERLPSGKFATNALVLLLGMVVHNILRVIGQLGLEVRVSPGGKVVVRRRLRSVMQDLMYLACRLVRHARRLRLGGRGDRGDAPKWGRYAAEGKDRAD